MNKASSPQKIEVKGWTFRVKYPSNLNEHTRILLLLHGHLGNENVMWILTKPLPDDIVILSPRAPIKWGENQFSWHKIGPNWPNIDTYQDILSELLVGINEWREQNHLLNHQLELMGFSQGAVMAYAFSILHPEIVGRVAALAGFIPNHWKDSSQVPALTGKIFYVAHGIKDEVVPIEKARQTASWLKEQGAQVTFCEADIGHKISANCFKGLGEFFINTH
jgi:phospholipase/carboxylesterase